MLRIIRLVLCAVCVSILLSGCSSTPAKITSVGRYGDAPVPQERGSSSTRTFDGTFDEVWDAARQVVARNGVFIEDSNKAIGKFTGSGTPQAICVGGPCAITLVYAMYFKELKGQEPRVEVTVMADAPRLYNWQGEGHTYNFVNRIIADLQKTLAAQR